MQSNKKKFEVAMYLVEEDLIAVIIDTGKKIERLDISRKDYEKWLKDTERLHLIEKGFITPEMYWKDPLIERHYDLHEYLSTNSKITL